VYLLGYRLVFIGGLKRRESNFAVTAAQALVILAVDLLVLNYFFSGRARQVSNLSHQKSTNFASSL